MQDPAFNIVSIEFLCVLMCHNVGHIDKWLPLVDRRRISTGAVSLPSFGVPAAAFAYQLSAMALCSALATSILSRWCEVGGEFRTLSPGRAAS